MVTRGTKAHRTPASTAYVSHVLDACGVPPRMLRCTRLVDLVNTMDPKLVAAAFGGCPGLRRSGGGGPRLMPAVW
jgi:hypothetical protein